MYRKTYILRWVVLLGAASAALGGAYAEDYTYQSLTNLGPCASSRVRLMNNDTNDICPIGLFTNLVDGTSCVSGQGYNNTNEAATIVGGTFRWHDAAAKPIGAANTQMQLLPGINHILYQKTDDAGGKKALWTLVECRAGAGGYNYASVSDNGKRNFLPWSDTCQPIDPVNFSAGRAYQHEMHTRCLCVFAVLRGRCRRNLF